MNPRAFSFGGGVQSVACLVLAAQGRIDFPRFVFADVGADSEHPATLAYLEEHARPFALAHGIDLVTVQRRQKDGTPDTLLGKVMRDQKSILLPMRMSKTGAPGNRSCTGDFKIKPIAKWFREAGATKEAPGVCGVGISLDEWQRMRSGSGFAYYTLEYPLIDLRLDRGNCEALIRDAGLPVPPKSACWFCPFHRLGAWREMYDRDRDLFDRSVALERAMNERRASLGLDPVWLTSRMRPLDEVVTGAHQQQLSLPFEVEEGHSCGPFACSGGGFLTNYLLDQPGGTP